MRRGARPSDVHRLEDERPAEEAPAEPHRRPPWGRLAVLLAAVIGAGLFTLLGRDGAQPVDVETEDDAVAALQLYLEQAQAVEALEGILPDERPRRAAVHAERVAAALEQARPRHHADAAARAYWGHRGHDAFLDALTAFEAGDPIPEPAGELYLRLYVRRLAPATVDALRGHPVGRPALDRLGEPYPGGP